MDDKYIIGIDPISNNSKGEAVICAKRRNGQYRIIRHLKWDEQMSLIKKIKYKFQVFKIYWLYFRGKTYLMEETNESKHNFHEWRKRQDSFDYNNLFKKN